jgi:uncharacterized protein (TIGR03382 family)
MWTFKDGSQIDPPGFDDPTISHMPECNGNQPKGACDGSGNTLHLGLQLVASNLEAYRSACVMDQAPMPCNADTPFLNFLITDGAYDSTDAQVQAPLLAMHEAGVVTHVIGYGANVDPVQLVKLAEWGSGATLPPTIANTQDELEAAFQGFLVLPVFDECCAFQQCDGGGEPMGETGDLSDTDDSFSTGENGGSTAGPNDTSTSTGETSTTGTTGLTGSTSNDTTSSTGSPDTGSTSGAESSSTAGFEASGLDGTAVTGDPAPTSDGSPTSDGTAADTDSSVSETADDPSETATDKGCGCASNDPAPGASLLLLGLLGLRRRRARAQSRV